MSHANRPQPAAATGQSNDDVGFALFQLGFTVLFLILAVLSFVLLHGSPYVAASCAAVFFGLACVASSD